jgi:ectoine hydroxylase-related dioxygenase (phytanoyl-CoA dioxygenase family)
MRSLGETWRKSLERDGYVVIPGVLGAEAVSGLLEALEGAQRGAGVLRHAGSVYGMRNLLSAVPEVRRLADTAVVRAWVEPILGPGALLVRGLLFDKPAHANWKVPWHQDLTIAVRERVETPGFGAWSVKSGVAHVQPPVSALEQMLAVRVHLDDCGEANGPLRVLPGSHGSGRLDAAAIRLWRERVTPIACVACRGEIVLMRPLLLHASSTARAPGHRRVIHLEFAADPLPGGLRWAEA